jgi:hypothetical protein
MADLATQISADSGQPKSITTDGLTTVEHSLPDQIAADKHLKQDLAGKATAAGKLPFQMFRFKPPGSSS